MHEGRVLLSPDELAEACGGTWENLPPDLYINNIRHVYRNTSADDLFVVHYDDWYLYKKSNVSEIPILIKRKNISAVMAKPGTKVPDGLPVLRVKNTYKALREIALATTARAKAKRVLVTGSFGKTSFKTDLYNLIRDQIKTYAMLGSSNRVAATYANLASLRQDTELLIIEQPISRKNNVFRRANYVRPDMLVITSIGHEHIEIYKSLEKIVQKKLSSIPTLAAGGKVVVPADDRYYDLIATELKNYPDVQVLRFGSGEGCDAQLIAAEPLGMGWKVNARIGSEYLEYTIPFVEDYAPAASLAPLLVAFELGLNIEQAAQLYGDARHYKTSGKLYEVSQPGRKFLLYDQSKRGGIEGFEAFFRGLPRITAQIKGRKLLLCSEIVDYKDGEFQYIDRPLFRKLIAESGLDAIYTVEKFDKHLDVLPEGGPWTRHSHKHEEIQDELLAQLRDGDFLCVKGIWESNLPAFINYLRKQPDTSFIALS